jgi:hypothetical protein
VARRSGRGPFRPRADDRPSRPRKELRRLRPERRGRGPPDGEARPDPRARRRGPHRNVRGGHLPRAPPRVPPPSRPLPPGRPRDALRDGGRRPRGRRPRQEPPRGRHDRPARRGADAPDRGRRGPPLLSHRERRGVRRHDRRHGAHRGHPLRAPEAPPARDAPRQGREAPREEPRRGPLPPLRGRAPEPLLGRVDRRPRARPLPRPRRPDAGRPPPARGASPGAGGAGRVPRNRGAARPVRRPPVPPRPGVDLGLQRPLLRRGTGRDGALGPRELLLPARRPRRLEPALRAARVRPIPGAPAARGGGGGLPPPSRGDLPRAGRLVPRRPEDDGRRGTRPPLLSSSRHHARARHPERRGAPAAPRAEARRDRPQGGRASLPRQGRPHRRRVARRDVPGPPPVPRGPGPARPRGPLGLAEAP